MKRRVAIVGGGIGGLTAAYTLQRDYADTCEYTLFEATARLGGTVETVRAQGYTIECGPDSWVAEKPWAEDLARELGLAEALRPSNDSARRTYIADKGSLIALPDSMRMVVPRDLSAIESSPLFTASARQQYHAEPARAEELRESALLHRGADADECVAAFVRRHFGSEVVETVARPLLAGILGGDIDTLSARALLAPFVTLEAQHGSLVAGLQQRPEQRERSVFMTLTGGLRILIDALHNRLRADSLRLQSSVAALRRAAGEWEIDLDGRRERYDRVLIAAPLDTTRALLNSIEQPHAHEAAKSLPVDAASGLVVALGFALQSIPSPAVPPGFGFLVRQDTAAADALLACTFLHRKFPGCAPPSATLLRAFFASAAAERLSSQDDEAIASVAREQLAALLGPLPRQADVTVVRRWPRSLPQYEVGHLARMRRFEQHMAQMPGLAVAGNFLRGVGLPDLIRDATRAAHALAAH